MNYCIVLGPERCPALNTGHTRCFKRSTLGLVQPTMQCLYFIIMRDHWHVISFCNVMFKIPHDFHRYIPLLDELSVALQAIKIPIKMLVCQRLFILMQGTWLALPFLLLSSASVSHFDDFSRDTGEKSLVM